MGSSKIELQWDNDFLLLDFNNSDNTTALGKLITIGQLVDNLVSMNVVWYKFEGLAQRGGSAGVADQPYLFLDLRPSNDGVFDVRVAKDQGKSASWVPLPVDTEPFSGTVHLHPPLGVNWRLQSGRRINGLHAKILNPDGTAATFTRCVILLATRSVLGTSVVGAPDNGARFSSTTLPVSATIKSACQCKK
jgi:hypothetical protein